MFSDGRGTGKIQEVSVREERGTDKIQEDLGSGVRLGVGPGEV
jgi:hypothetical protein